MTEKIRILIADDHAILRQGTIALLRKEQDLEIIGDASNGQEAIDLAHRLKPDVVVMDVRMPEVSGVEATRQISSDLRDVRIIILSAHDDDQYIYSAIEAGASGYLLKSAPINELINAIHQVYQGEASLDPAITAKLIRRMSKSRKGVADIDEESGVEKLTSRELEVLRSLAEGLSNKAIAEKLFISERTVQAHLTNIYSKLQVSSRTGAILAGIKLGWLTVES